MHPAGDRDRRRADAGIKLLELERSIFSAWCGFLFRPEVPFLGGGKEDFESALRQMSDELSQNTQSDWFLSYQYPTIVDMQYVSHVERMVASALFYKGYDIRVKFPAIDAWLKAFEKLPYYMASKSDYYTHCMDIPPQYGEPYPSDNDTALRARALLNPAQARLPVTWETDPEPQTQAQAKMPESDHRMEAAWRLVSNHEAVARFCARAAGQGVGQWGRNNPYRSYLADPYAKPNLDVAKQVEVLLGAVASSLLSEEDNVAGDVLAAAKAAGLPSDEYKTAAQCLAYLRDRIGVPRDMQMPAAKLLRAYLGEAVAALEA